MRPIRAGADAEIRVLEYALKDNDENVRLMSASLILDKENTDLRRSSLDELALKTLYDLALSSDSAITRRLATELIDTLPPEVYSADIVLGKRIPDKRITVLAEVFKSYTVEDKKNDLKVIACAELLEGLYKAQGSDNSRECLVVKLERLKCQHGDKHKEVLSLYEQLGDLCRKEKDFSEAQRYYKLAMECYDKGNRRSVDCARARVNLAQVYFDRMDPADALQECHGATTIIVDTLGVAHPESVRARLLLAQVQSRLAENADNKYVAELDNGGRNLSKYRWDALAAAVDAHAAYVNALESAEKCYGKDSPQAIELSLAMTKFYFCYPDGQEFILNSQKRTAIDLGMMAADKLLAYAAGLMKTGPDGARHAAEIAEKVKESANELERIGDKKIRTNDFTQLQKIELLHNKLYNKAREIEKAAMERVILKSCGLTD